MLANTEERRKMKKGLQVLLLSFFGFLILNKSAYAYLDPGTGGIILSSLWLLILAFLTAVAAFLAKHFWHPLKKRISNLRNKNTESIESNKK